MFQCDVFLVRLIFAFLVPAKLLGAYHTNNWHRQMSPTSNQAHGDRAYSSSNGAYSNSVAVDDARRSPTNLSTSRHRTIFRPKASDSLPVAALLENPDTKYDPSLADLDEAALRRLLGNVDFDQAYSSITKPSVASPNGTNELPFGEEDSKFVVHAKIPRHFRNLFKQPELPNGAQAKLRMKSALKRRVYDYLWAYTYCPVKYAWKDLGARFWPRWIKEGKCVTKRSCSVPPGMSCKPESSKHVVVLRWHCRNFHTAYYCNWIKINYPVLTSCACSC